MHILSDGVFQRLDDAVRRYAEVGGPDEDSDALAVALAAWEAAGYPLYNAPIPEELITRTMYRRRRARLAHLGRGFLLGLTLSADSADRYPWTPKDYWMLKERARRATDDQLDGESPSDPDERLAGGVEDSG